MLYEVVKNAMLPTWYHTIDHQMVDRWGVGAAAQSDAKRLLIETMSHGRPRAEVLDILHWYQQGTRMIDYLDMHSEVMPFCICAINTLNRIPQRMWVFDGTDGVWQIYVVTENIKRFVVPPVNAKCVMFSANALDDVLQTAIITTTEN